MKTSSSDLFLLIKAMTKSEKGHFKKQSNYIKGDKIYLRLFDAIDCQQEYDENKIKEKFKDEPFIQQLSVAKINLYSNILKSLSQSSISSNTRFELRAGVNNAEILFNKGLASQALKLIKKLKSDALEIEDFDILLLLLNLQKTIILKTFSDIDTELDAIYREEIEIIDKRKNFVSYQRLFNKSFYLLTRYGHIRNKKEEAKYEEILQNEHMRNEKLANSVSSKIHYNEVFLYYYISKMDFSEALKRTTKCIELLDKNQRFLKAHIDKFVSIYQNHILQYYYLENYSSVESAYRKLLTFLNNRKLNISERLKAYSTGKILCIRFVSFIRSTNFDAAAEAQKEIKQLISNYSHLLDNSIKIILFNMSSYYNFIEENYTEALKWINMMLNDKEMKYFIEMFCNAKWFELLIHYELKNYNYIDNILNTNERYIDKKQKLYGIEKLMIKFLKDALRSDDITSHELFHKLLSDIRKIANKQTESDYGIDYFNIAEWVNSKMENKPLKKILKENHLAATC